MTGFLCNTKWHWHNKPVAGKKKALPKQFGNVGQICKTSGPKSYFPLRYPNKKAHLAPCFTANLPFGGNIAHPTPSVFHADQRGGGTFLIWTLWLEFWGHPRIHGDPQHQQHQGLILEHNSLKSFC